MNSFCTSKKSNDKSRNYSFVFSFCFIFFFSVPFTIHAQICEGNLGENIFESGDFGSGQATFLLQDPQIAPGFEYTTNPPPNDGFYTITNDMNDWQNVFGGWLRASDNSPDPNGYMMVVNASYSPGLFYEQQITGLCDNTVYEFSADVLNLIEMGTDIIKPNISFLIEGQSVFTTGDVAEDEQWHTYGFLFSTEPGQNTITLALRNNAPGGIGNDLAIDNITFRPCGPEALILPVEIANICEDGDPIQLDATVDGEQYDMPAFQWQTSFDEGDTWVTLAGENGATYDHTELAAGFYYYRYLLANGMDNLTNSKCRVVSNTKIVHVVPKFYTVVDTICDGLIYSIGNSEYSMSGFYTDSLLSSIGCDSIVNLDLTVLPDAQIGADYQINPPSCFDSANGSIELNEIINGTPPFIASIDNSFLTIPSTYSDIGAGDYLLSISDYFGCDFETIINLPAPTPLVIDLGDDQIVDLGDEIDIFVTSNQEINNLVWQPAALNDCEPDCLQLQWTPENSGVVTLMASSLDNCMAIDSVFILVRDVRKVFIPNVFSPNLDGANDKFMIFGDIPNIQEIEKFQVFNRWGSVIFEQTSFQPNDTTKGWDGTYNGKYLGADIFLYYAEIRFLDGEIIQYTGDVSLLR